MAAGKGHGTHELSPVPDRTISVLFRSGQRGSYTGQIMIRDGVLVIYDDLPGGSFFTKAGIPLTSIEVWQELPPPEPEP
jgi:hypothetical protein